MIGKDISHYRILEKLGEGGMGVVYKAEDTKLKRTVALKFLLQKMLKGEEVKLRFLREAQAAAALVHPNIATIFEFDEWKGEYFIAMEYVEGQTLDHLLNAGPVPLDLAIEYSVAIADALSLAHGKGIIHRDIKPANIMVAPEDKMKMRRQIKVMDFGLARLREADKLTLSGPRMGTVAYMSPEQARGEKMDQRTDIFSLGVVFYEMLAGERPFAGEYETALVYSIVHEEPFPLSQKKDDIPEELEKIVFKTLAKDPNKRYQTMEDLLADLASFQYKPQTLAIKAGPKKKSIAVLPFEDISPGKQNQYLADGMTEELILELSQNKELRVIARTSVMQYKKHAKDAGEISRELGVSHIVEGSVRRYEDNLRVTSQLIDASDGSHLWADKFDGMMKDVFSFQEEVANQVADALRIELGTKLKKVPAKLMTQAKPYEYYLQGKFLLDSPTLKNLDRSVSMLERALELDPQYAAAYGSLANAYLWYVDTGLRPDPEYLIKAEETAQKALALDKDQPDALYTLANLTMKKGDVEEALKAFSQVLEFDPNHRDARLFGGILTFMSSFLEEALQEADRLLSTNPFWPMAHWLHSTIRLHQGMFDAAVAEYETVVVEVPSKLVWLALAYRYAGKMDKAWKAAQKVKELEPKGILWLMAFAFLDGAEGKGKKILKYIDERVKAFAWDFNLCTYWVASLYAMAGEKDEAFRWLERGIEIGNRNHRWFEIDPNLENLRDDPRYGEILPKARTAAQKLVKQLTKDT